MATQLSKLFEGYKPWTLPQIPQTPLFSQGSPFAITPRTQTLPNGGGMFSGATTQPVTFPNMSVMPKQAVPPFSAPVAKPSAPAPAPGPTIPPEWRNPAGGFYTAKQIAANELSAGAPSGLGDIPTYAGNSLTQGPQTTEQMITTAAGLNNARNDIATGATDPYKVGNKSGIPYSYDELNAIQKAYAGIYDPAINSAIAKLEKKQQEDLIRFNTDENIRQYKATTALNKTATVGATALGIARDAATGYGKYEDYLAKATAYEAAGNNISNFVTHYPASQYLSPEDVAKLPKYLQSELTLQEQKNVVWKELARPEVAALTDEEKAKIIQEAYGLNPKDFLPFWFPNI